MISIAYVTLRSAKVQNYLSDKIETYLSQELGAAVNIGGVDISMFLRIILEDISIEDKEGNSLLFAEKLKIGVSGLSIAKKKVNIATVQIKKGVFQFQKYQNQEKLNIQFLIDYFSKQDTVAKEKKDAWIIALNSIKLIDNEFKYIDHNKNPKQKGVDFSNLHFKRINLEANPFKISDGIFYLKLKQLSFIEKSGFGIKNLSVQSFINGKHTILKSLTLETANSDIRINAWLRHNEFKQIFDSTITDKVNLSLGISSSTVATEDIVVFVPALKGMYNDINISLKAKGKINDFKTDGLILKYGESTFFSADVEARNITRPKETFFNLDIYQLRSSVDELSTISLPEKNGTSPKIKVPNQLKNVGNFNLNGHSRGVIQDFMARANVKTEIGTLFTNFSLTQSNNNIPHYEGNVSATTIQLNELLQDEKNFGVFSMESIFKGRGFQLDKLNLDIEATISEFNLKQYQYENILVSGNFEQKKFTGLCQIYDENIGFDFNGTVDLNDTIPKYDFQAKIDSAYLHKLNLLNDSTGILSSEIRLKASGNTLDNFQGVLHISDLEYNKKGVAYTMTSMFIASTIDPFNREKYNTITSDFFEADWSGKINYIQLGDNILSYLNNHIPEYMLNYSDTLEFLEGQNFDFDIILKNTETITDLFMPKLRLKKNGTISGSYNSKSSQLNLFARLGETKYGNQKFDSLSIRITGNTNNIKGEIKSSEFHLSDSSKLDNFKIMTTAVNDSIKYQISWNDFEITNHDQANIKGFAHFSKDSVIAIKIQKSNLTIVDSNWVISPNNKIIIDTSNIRISNLQLQRENQMIKIDGEISKDPDKTLSISFNDFNLSNSDFILNQSDVDLDGIIEGNTLISNLYDNPNIKANIKIKEFGFNNDLLGDAEINSYWDPAKKGFNIKSEIIYTGNIGQNKPIDLSGYYYPQANKNNFDLTVELQNLKLKTIESYISDFAKLYTGHASGVLKIRGKPNAPELTGTLTLRRFDVQINFLKTRYVFTHDFTIDKDKITFTDLVLTDRHNNSAKCNGTIHHENFKNFLLDITIEPDNLLSLNTSYTDNNMFYGTAYASGIINIYGSLNNLFMDINAKTESDTRMFIPISSGMDISENTFVKFTTKENIKDTVAKVEEIKVSGLNLNFNLNVTPEAQIQIILDEKVGDIIKARGNADLIIEIDSWGDFSMFGTYQITEGDYLFTLENVINKHFQIRKGSQLEWNGSPYDAIMDIDAVYKTRTALAPLYDPTTQNILNPDTSNKRVPVNCIINLEERLFNPEITFDIEFPTLPVFQQEQYEAVIKPNLSYQFVSLLAMNTFVSPNQGGASYANQLGQGTSSNSMELISSQFSNWVSKISNDFDIGFNYRPGDEITSDELEVALSTQLFNDRVIIDGNIGVGGETTTSQQQNSSNLVGDVNIEYKWDPEGQFRVKAFNRSNRYDVLDENPAAYTQGVGIVYRKEFNTLSELFSRKKKKPMAPADENKQMNDTINGSTQEADSLLKQSSKGIEFK